MVEVHSLSDAELRQKLIDYNQSPGPITDSTRVIYQKKLAKLLMEASEEARTEPRMAQQQYATPANDHSPRRRRPLQHEESDKSGTDDYSSDESNYEGSRYLSPGERRSSFTTQQHAVKPASRLSSVLWIVGVIVLIVTLYFILDHYFNDPDNGGFSNKETV